MAVLQIQQEISDLPLGREVQGRKGLVQNQHLGLHGKGSCNRHSLPLTTAQLERPTYT